MPRIKQTPAEIEDAQYRGLIRGQMERYGITRRKLAGYLGIDEETMRYKLKDTDKLKLKEARIIDRVLKISTVRSAI